MTDLEQQIRAVLEAGPLPTHHDGCPNMGVL